MIQFSYDDKIMINDFYKSLLINLKNYLIQYNSINELEYSKIILEMLHKGFFSINRKIQFDNNYDYLEIPSEISEGVQVMYGICCCRHATSFLYDLLCILNFNTSIVYYFIDSESKVWNKVNPAVEKANHQAILINNENEYIVDPANKFILEKQKNDEVKLLNFKYSNNLKDYQDDNIYSIEKVLQKYYICKELGIKIVY